MAGPKRQGGAPKRAPRKQASKEYNEKTGIVKKRFSSISAFGDYVHTLERDGVTGRPLDYIPSKKPPQQAWDYNTDFATALDMTRNGGAWHDGAQQLSEVDISTAPTEDYTIKPYFDLAVAGGCVDVGEYLAGSPECMQGYNDDHPNTPVLVVRYVAPVSCQVTADQMFNYGRAMLALIDALENKGYSVELTALYPCMSDGNGALAEIVVKQAGDNWSAGAIAFAMCHPAFSRRVGFRFAEAFDESYNARNKGYTLDRYTEREQGVLFFGYQARPEPLTTPERAYTTVLNTAKHQLPEVFA